MAATRAPNHEPSSPIIRRSKRKRSLSAGVTTPMPPTREKRNRLKAVNTQNDVGSSPLAIRTPRPQRDRRPPPPRDLFQEPVRKTIAGSRPHERLQAFRQQLGRKKVGTSISSVQSDETTMDSVKSGQAERPITIRSSPPSDDYDIKFDLRLRVNKMLVKTPYLASCSRSTLRLADIEEAFQPFVEAVISPTVPTESVISLHVKGKKKTGKARVLVIDDFSLSSQDQILDVIDSVKDDSKPPIMLAVEMKLSFNIKEMKMAKEQERRQAATDAANREHANEANSSAPVSPNPIAERVITSRSGRTTRTTQMSENQVTRLMAQSEAGDAEAQLRIRWKCRQNGCHNEAGYCFIMSDDEKQHHYRMERIHLEPWGNHIAAGYATVEKPMFEHAKFIMGVGQVTVERPRPQKGSNLDRLMERMGDMSEKLFEMTASQSLMGTMTSLMDRQAAAMVRQPRETPIPTTSAISSNLVASLPAPVVARGLETTINRTITPPSQVQRTAPPSVALSSPIRGHDESDYDIIEGFLNWRIRTIRGDSAKTQWEEVAEMIRTNLWSISDLKAMEREGSAQAREAETAGIPRPIARSFREQLRRYRRHQITEADEISRFEASRPYTG